MSGSCACRIAKIAILLHFILLLQQWWGAGGHKQGEEGVPPQALLVCQPHRKLSSCEGFRSPPAGSSTKARAFLCLAASEVWVLRSWH